MNVQKLEVTITGIDEATQKVERYVELLKEAKTLADELASPTEIDSKKLARHFEKDRRKKGITL